MPGGGLSGGTNVLRFAAKLRHCRKRMKEWNGTYFHSNSNAAKKSLSDEIQKIDLQEEAHGLSCAQQGLRANLKKQLAVLLRDEEVWWKLRAKQHWLKEGDGNTKFFHAMANARKRVNHIEFVEEDGCRLTREADLSAYFYDKFKERFTPDDQCTGTFGDWSDVFSADLPLGADHLTAPFTEAEIKKATFQLGTDKAPGPDGFSMAFFQRFWEVIKEDLVKLFEDLFAGSLQTGPIDYSYICLVPKKEGARCANDFRPISLINCVQKIISKVLANRLEPVLPEIISSSQTAFLKGRLILDSFVTANEIISWGTKEKIDGVGIKADFEKAFDRVSWGFLRNVLLWLGANQKWLGWID